MAQGFAGLGTSAEGFAVPRRGHPFHFPADHAAHPNFRIEWWYVTANLVAADGRKLGAQWTLFRSALAPGNQEGWSDPQIWIGHAAVTTQQRHYVSERLGRGGSGQSGVIAQPFEAWIDDWQVKARTQPLGDQLDHLELKADDADFSYQLSLNAMGPLVLQGDKGFSIKSASGQASYYYSQPFYEVKGKVILDGEPVDVSGNAWLDREWSSQPLAGDQTGWDWFSLHLASGEKLMAFRLRDGKGGYISANWIAADGTTEVLDSETVSLEPLRTTAVAGREVPVSWRLTVASKGLDITTAPLNDQSWMNTSTPYWEGPITFSGSGSGVGYLEMTGY
jgi:predicted secreted hydrolase